MPAKKQLLKKTQHVCEWCGKQRMCKSVPSWVRPVYDGRRWFCRRCGDAN
jgi:hypothetical protein